MNDLEIRNLTKRFGDRTAVDSLTLDVGAGELFALLGVNGAGKTTTVRMLSCLTRPDAGDALVCGNSIIQDPRAVKAVIGISPQQTAVAPNLTVRENLTMMAGLFGLPDAAARAEELIEELSLGEAAARRAKVLSGGWQRRLSIAMGLVSRPRVLFLDEPTLGLDVLARRELWHVVSSLKGKTTVILTTHYLEEAEALSDRVGVMAGGKLLAVDTAAGLTARAGAPTFEDAFVRIASGEVTL